MSRSSILSMPVVALLLMELLERLAYYAAVFTFTTYSVSMLGYSVKESNALLQGLWALSPLAALGASALADERWGRPKTVAVFGCLYVLALGLIALSASPSVAFYQSFPTKATPAAEALFLIGVLVLGIGYGGMKSSVSPLVADTAFKKRHLHLRSTEWSEDVPILPDTAECRSAKGTADSYEAMGESSLSQESVREEEERAVMSSLFRWYYWTFNIGALIGSTVGPLLLPLDPRKIPGESNSNGDNVSGYYCAYWMSMGSTALGMLVFFTCYKKYASPPTDADFKQFFKLFCFALTRPFRRCVGRNNGQAPVRDKQSDGTQTRPLTEPKEGFSEDEEVSSPSRTEESLAVISRVLLIFSALPIYWLISNQYASNLVLQASWLELPSGFQPELFANVNTLSSLIFLPLLDRCILPMVMKGKRPSAVRRMVIGFALCIFGLCWCGVLQLMITQRGRLEDENYYLYEGQTQLSAAWLIVPYILQGVASVLVDTTSIETAYMLAPANMKSFVHALYLMCSSASGWIGLLIAPAVTPSTYMICFFSFAFALAMCSALFDRFAYSVEQLALKKAQCYSEGQPAVGKRSGLNGDRQKSSRSKVRANEAV